MRVFSYFRVITQLFVGIREGPSCFSSTVAAEIGAGYSGQVRLRMPKHLHRALAMEAEIEGVSLNTLMVTRLASGGKARA